MFRWLASAAANLKVADKGVDVLRCVEAIVVAALLVALGLVVTGSLSFMQ